MKFSSSSQSAITEKPSIIEDIDFQCNTDSTSFPVADKLRAINKALHYVTNLILRYQNEEDWDDSNYADFPIATTSLVATQQDYTLPTGWLKIQRVEVKYDSDWYKAEPFDIGESSDPMDTTTIGDDFDEEHPYYDLRSGSLFLFPIPDTNVSAGLKLWYLREPDEFTRDDTTQEPGFHEAFHPLISYIPSLEYLTAKGLNKDKQDWLREQRAILESRLASHYGTKQEDRHIVIKSVDGDYE